MAKLPILSLICAAALAAQAIAASGPGERLVRAYPAFLSHVDGGAIVWRDGTRMELSDGNMAKTPDQAIEVPDLDDMVALPYPKGPVVGTPASDPGRARFVPFFQKMYGGCSNGEVAKNLVWVAWLPEHGGGRVQVTRVNGVDKALAAVSEELARLPSETIRTFLVPSAGTYVCRAIAGTGRQSAHSWGIAIDIATRRSDYWRWPKGRPYRNRIPQAVVDIFERHGFIWGGKWKSFDTMHFEYRPELLLD